jgi:hypothetical protein
MPKPITQYMDKDERAAWHAMLDAALTASKMQADQAAIDHLAQSMATAEKSDPVPVWPAILRQRWTREGMRIELLARAKASAMVMVNHKGHLIGKTALRSAEVTAKDGTRQQKQFLWASMTWEQFDDWRARNRDADLALQINEAAAVKIAALRERAPKSKTPGDACKQLGTTIEEVLAS